MAQETVPGQISPLGYQQITTLSAATSLTVPKGATYAVIQAEGADIRWRDDGTDPTASVGMVIASGDTLPFAARLGAVRFIQETAGGVLNISYYGL